MASADFSSLFSDESSPGNDTLLCCTAATFTSAGIPVDFGVLCLLIAIRRPFMWFLSIGSQRSPSLPSPLRSPSGAWLQIVVSSFPWFGISTGDLNPIYNAPMLGTHKARHPIPDKLLEFSERVCSLEVLRVCDTDWRSGQGWMRFDVLLRKWKLPSLAPQ